jgi:hypothetical protein
VTCISAARKSDNIFCILRKVINDFSLAFIAPLGTHYYNIHGFTSFRRIIAE